MRDDSVATSPPRGKASELYTSQSFQSRWKTASCHTTFEEFLDFVSRRRKIGSAYVYKDGAAALEGCGPVLRWSPFGSFTSAATDLVITSRDSSRTEPLHHIHHTQSFVRRTKERTRASNS